MGKLIDVIKVFFNSLIFSLLITVLICIFTFATLKILALVRPFEAIPWNLWIALLLVSLFGAASIMTIRCVIETKPQKNDSNRFKRFYTGSIALKAPVKEDDIVNLLTSLGYQNIEVNIKAGLKIISALFLGGIYSLPADAGGYKKYETKVLRITIAEDGLKLFVDIGPRDVFIPTAFVFSNYYYFKVLMNALLVEPERNEHIKF